TSAGGGPGGEMVWVPRVARRRPGQVEGGTAEGELVGGELAEHHRARLGELADRGCVPLRDERFEVLGVRGRRDAGGAVNVLVSDRDAVERTFGRAGHHPLLGG